MYSKSADSQRKIGLVDDVRPRLVVHRGDQASLVALRRWTDQKKTAFQLDTFVRNRRRDNCHGSDRGIDSFRGATLGVMS